MGSKSFLRERLKSQENASSIEKSSVNRRSLDMIIIQNHKRKQYT